jgi:hypothetical protein
MTFHAMEPGNQEAKNELSEVVEEAIEKEPQVPLSELFRQAPLGNLDLERDWSLPRPEPELSIPIWVPAS